MKKYFEKIMNSINGQIGDVSKKRKSNQKWLKIGTGLAAVLGTYLLFSNPWFGISVIGGAIAINMERKTTEHNLANSEEALIKQKTRVAGTLEDNFDPRKATSQEKKNIMSALENQRKAQEAGYLSSSARKHLTGALIGGSIALAGFFENPFFAIATFGSMGLKHFADKTNRKTHDQLENTVGELNSTIYEYNMGVKKIQEGTTAPRRTVQPQRTTENQTKQVIKRRVSKEEEEAVDAYLRYLESQKAQTNNKTKKKV